MKARLEAEGWAFVVRVSKDLEPVVSPTLRTVTAQALDATADPSAARALVHQLGDRRENPTLAATVWQETVRQLGRALLRAMWAENRARRSRRHSNPRQLSFGWDRP